MEKNKKGDNVQGTEAHSNNPSFTKNKQAKSVTYAIKAIGEHAKTLRDAGYMNIESYTAFEEWRTTTGGEILKKQLGL